MKVEVKEVEKEGFKPFKIEMTIESLAELKDLHNRMNVCSNVVNKSVDRYWCNTEIDLKIHRVLTDKLKSLGVIF